MILTFSQSLCGQPLVLFSPAAIPPPSYQLQPFHSPTTVSCLFTFTLYYHRVPTISFFKFFSSENGRSIYWPRAGIHPQSCLVFSLLPDLVSVYLLYCMNLQFPSQLFFPILHFSTLERFLILIKSDFLLVLLLHLSHSKWLVENTYPYWLILLLTHGQ